MSCEAVDESLLVPATESNIKQQIPALRVENLNVDVTEKTLRKVFRRVGGVKSVSISRDPVTMKSNGIGHVKFINMDYGMPSFQTLLTSANAALDQLNNTLIDGRPCQLTWYKKKSMDLEQKFQFLREINARMEAMSISPNLFETLLIKAGSESASYQDSTSFKPRVFSGEDIKPLPPHVSQYFTKNIESLLKTKPLFGFARTSPKTK